MTHRSILIVYHTCKRNKTFYMIYTECIVFKSKLIDLANFYPVGMKYSFFSSINWYEYS